MNIDNIIKQLGETPDLSTVLGMEFLSTPEDDTCMARMHVDERNRQPFGYLSGGASMALAEHLAGIGSICMEPEKICMGINVTAQHVKTASEGETVTAVARLKHRGNTFHVWDVEITNEAGELVSTISVTNYIIRTNK